MNKKIEELIAICCEQPFDVVKIDKYIKENQMSSEEVTRAAIKVCDYGEMGYVNFMYEFGREPEPQELAAYNWEKLFDVLIENGVDPNLVICDDGKNYENIMQSAKFLDNGITGVLILRNLLEKGGDVNLEIGGIPFFIEIDDDFVFDIEMQLHYYKHNEKIAFYTWLLLIGFGGRLKNGSCPVQMKSGFSPDIFKEFEKFDYVVDRSEKEFVMTIYNCENGTVVATL